MPTLSNASAINQIKQPTTKLKRFMAFAQREIICEIQVSRVIYDEDSGGIVQVFGTRVSGDYSKSFIDMTLDVGTSRGLWDVGKGHMRFKGSNAFLNGGIEDQIFVGEIDPADMPLQSGMFLSLVRELRPWQKKPRIKQIKNGADYYNEFIELHDSYHKIRGQGSVLSFEYVDQNENYPPKPNITGLGEYAQARPYYFRNSGNPVTLDASQSYSFTERLRFADGANLTFFWSIEDGTTTQNITSSYIEVLFDDPDVDFRYISLTAFDETTGVFDTMFFPVWSFDSENDPNLISNFEIKSHQGDVSGGWNITCRVNQKGFSKRNNKLIPKGTPIVVFETGGVGQEYISTFFGWSLKEEIFLEKYNYENLITINGIAHWLDAFGGFNQKLRTVDNPETWSEMKEPTIDHVSAYILREYSNALNIVSFHPSRSQQIIPGEQIKKSNIWQQLIDLQKANYMGMPGADSVNAIYMRPHYSYLPDEQRSSVNIVLDFDKTFLPHESSPKVNFDFSEKLLNVLADGSSYEPSTGTSTFYAAEAPGKVGSYSSSQNTMPFQRLDTVDAQDKLKNLAGMHFAHENREISNIQITFLGNNSYLEPCWNEPVSFTWRDENNANIDWVNKLFIVTQVSHSHNYSGNAPDKVTSWTLEPVTTGIDGTEREIQTNPNTNEPNPYDDDPLPTNDGTIAMVLSDGQLLITENFLNASGPTWSAQQLNLDGTVVQFKPYPANSTGGIIVTTTKIYTISNIFGTPVVTEVFSFIATSETRSLDISRGFKFAAVASTYPLTETATFVTYTSDFTNWVTEEKIGGINNANPSEGSWSYYFNFRTNDAPGASYENFGFYNSEANHTGWGHPGAEYLAAHPYAAYGENRVGENRFGLSSLFIGDNFNPNGLPVTLTKMTMTIEYAFGGSRNIAQAGYGGWLYIAINAQGFSNYNNGTGEILDYSQLIYSLDVNNGNYPTTTQIETIEWNGEQLIDKQYAFFLYCRYSAPEFTQFSGGKCYIWNVTLEGNGPDPWYPQNTPPPTTIDLYAAPGCYVSDKNPGQITVSAAITGNSINIFRRQQDFSLQLEDPSYGQFNWLENPGIRPSETNWMRDNQNGLWLLGDIEVPFLIQNETEESVLYGSRGESGNYTEYVYLNKTDRRIFEDIQGYRPWGPNNISAGILNSSIIAIVGTNASDDNILSSNVGIWITRDGGLTFNNPQPPTPDNNNGGRHEGVLVNENKVYLFGTYGKIAYSENGGLNITPKTGNISDLSITSTVKGITKGLAASTQTSYRAIWSFDEVSGSAENTVYGNSWEENTTNVSVLGSAEYISGVGYRRTISGSATSDKIAIYLDIPTVSNIKKVKIIMSEKPTGGALNRISVRPSVSFTDDSQVVNIDDPASEVSFPVNWNASGISIQIRTDGIAVPSVIQKVVLEGDVPSPISSSDNDYVRIFQFNQISGSSPDTIYDITPNWLPGLNTVFESKLGYKTDGTTWITSPDGYRSMVESLQFSQETTIKSVEVYFNITGMASDSTNNLRGVYRIESGSPTESYEFTGNYSHVNSPTIHSINEVFPIGSSIRVDYRATEFELMNIYISKIVVRGSGNNPFTE